jgi:hypothetical protein
MTMRQLLIHMAMFGAAVGAAAAPAACGRGPSPADSDAASGPPATRADASDSAADASTPSSRDAGASEPEPGEDDGHVMILGTHGRVSLHRAGRVVPILRNVSFVPGDTLHVEEASTAIVHCRDVCVLGTGVYRRCCTPECRTDVALHPPRSAARVAMVAKRELGRDEARLLEEQERRIAALDLGETTARFLRSNLYVNWKLEEAAGEVEALSKRLDRPEARRELREIYAPFVRKTGDLFRRLNKPDRAIDRYKKATGVAPPRPRTGADPAAAAEAAREKARAHTSLADVYVESGKPRQAVDSLSRAREIYRAQGDAEKAAETDRAILKYRGR